VKYRSIDEDANVVQNGTRQVIPDAVARSFYAFVALIERKQTPVTAHFIKDRLREYLITTGAKYYSKKEKKEVLYTETSNMDDVYRGMMARLDQTGFILKERSGYTLAQARAFAEEDVDSIKNFAQFVNWRIFELSDVFYQLTNGTKMLGYGQILHCDEWQLPMNHINKSSKFLVTADRKIQNIVPSERAPTVSVLTYQLGAKPLAPVFICIADPRIPANDVNPYVPEANYQNSAARVISTSNGWFNEKAQEECFCILCKSPDNDVGGENFLAFMLFDAHYSHHSLNLLKMMWANNVHPCCPPPHLTHILQPMDATYGVITGIS